MTQRRKSVLDWQIANRRADAYILDLAYNAMKTKAPSVVSNVDLGTGDGLSCLGSKGMLELQHHHNRIDVTFEWTSATDPGIVPCDISDYVTLYFSRCKKLNNRLLSNSGLLHLFEVNNLQTPWFGWFTLQYLFILPMLSDQR
jgi:hypothetical protein